jgi:hypothetical protein
MLRSTTVQIIILVAWVLLVWVSFWGQGLPSRMDVQLLFGDRTPWSGAKIVGLLGEDSGKVRGADVDANAIRATTQPVLLNGDDQSRAQIVRRYRLMSRLPDEFITLKALAEMNQRSGIDKLDPRLYQYGGLWIYPSGALVKLSTMMGVVRSPPAGVSTMEFYLDRPDQFGKFYVLLRAMSTAWGVLLLGCVWWIVNRATSSDWLATGTAMLTAVMPVVWAMAVEAKPHMAAATMTLLCVCLGATYVGSGRVKWLTLSALCAGAAAGLVLTGAMAMVVPLAAAMMRKESRVLRSLLGIVCGVALFVMTNPFVVYNAIAAPELLSSNIGNTRAMYHIGWQGVGRSIYYLYEGAGLVAFFALVVLVLWGVRKRAGETFGAELKLLIVVGMVTLVPYMLLSNGKSMEYVRFAIVPVVALCVVLAARFSPPRGARVMVVAAAASAIVIFFALADAMNNREKATSSWLSQRKSVSVYFEPAPWSMPAADIFEKQIWLLPRSMQSSGHVEFAIVPANLQYELGIDGYPREQVSWHFNQWIGQETKRE